MKNKICMLGALLLMLTANSCRQETDIIQNYSSNDILPFEKADSCFENQFKIFWHGMNQNYCLFAYDRTFGLDWDAVYDEFLPQFQALDKQDYVTDDELKELITKATEGIHDGHFYTSFLNYHTDNRVIVQPVSVKNQARPDLSTSVNFSLDLSHYYPKGAGGNGEFKTCQTASSRYVEFFSGIRNDSDKGLTWINAQLKKLNEKALLNQTTDHDAFLRASYAELSNKLMKLLDTFDGRKSIEAYNELVASYEYLKVPGLLPYDIALMDNSIMALTGVTQDNIAYFYISDFALSPCISDSYRKDDVPDLSTNGVSLLHSVGFVWQQWFNSVQSLIKSGQLKGVIIDLRSNGGGLLDDFPYVVGSLLPSGSHQIGYGYSKRGVGRFDYSVKTPYHIEGYPEAHEVITDQPVVMLTNCRSVSMAEVSTLTAKELLHACQIGTTSWGGLCALNDNSTYGGNYAGYVGIEDKTAVYCYIPQLVFSDLDGVVHESVGLTPDIELSYDAALMKAENRDNQFERALQYIRENSK